MPTPTKNKSWYIFFMLVLLPLVTSGCASPAGNNQPSEIAEVAYIDLKLGFSLVVPSSWKRQRHPVSSPLHRPNAVEWLTENTNAPNETQGSLLVSLLTPDSPQDYLAKVKEEQPTIADVLPENIHHPAGPTLRWVSEENLISFMLLSIQGQKRSYFITYKTATANYPQNLSTIEKIIASFTILPE